MLLASSKNINVGSHTYYNCNIDLRPDDNAKIHIGKYCAFGKNLKIITTNHDYNFPCILGKFYDIYFKSLHPGVINKTEIRTKGDVIIGNDVWIGDDVIILSGVTIGNGAIIGCNSVVTKNVDPYSIHAGCPAKFIKKRYSSETIDFLIKLNWYDWNEEKIKKNKDFFYLNMNEINVNDVKKNIK
jgi:acetyltransferase-like isoleucine patch superfamily enzyme